ncbi:MAG: YicC family protein [Tissierellia bacterium]|nr:YicC family protein [Tissierellia bacterium]
MGINYSMTGYGLCQLDSQGLNVKIEMKSVNSRFLEVNIRMPRNYLAMEMELKRRLQEKISRGKLDIFINITASQSMDRELLIDYELIEKVSGLINDERLPLEKTLSFRDLLSLEGALVFKDKKNELVEAMIIEAFDGALESLMESRKREGQALGQHIEGLLFDFETLIQGIKEMAPQWKNVYRQGLRDRLSQLLEDEKVINEERLEFELALFTDKKDIEEEVARSLAHIKAFKKDLAGPGPHGRKLDFLVQELVREVNTMGSKSGLYDLTREVIEAKSLLEQIREQLQNVE